MKIGKTSLEERVAGIIGFVLLCVFCWCYDNLNGFADYFETFRFNSGIPVYLGCMWVFSSLTYKILLVFGTNIRKLGIFTVFLFICLVVSVIAYAYNINKQDLSLFSFFMALACITGLTLTDLISASPKNQIRRKVIYENAL